MDAKDLEKAVIDAINAIRPALQNDGGDVLPSAVDDFHHAAREALPCGKSGIAAVEKALFVNPDDLRRDFILMPRNQNPERRLFIQDGIGTSENVRVETLGKGGQVAFQQEACFVLLSRRAGAQKQLLQKILAVHWQVAHGKILLIFSRRSGRGRTVWRLRRQGTRRRRRFHGRKFFLPSADS